MKISKWLGVVLLALACSAAIAQNYTAISASNITDANGTKLAAGQVCFTGTDAFDAPLNFMVGGGGTILKRPICFNVANGAITTAVNGGAVQIPNPANTSPGGITYRVQARDTLSNQLVIDYRKVVFTGASFSLDTYAPTGIAVLPLTGGTVNGPLSVNGNLSATGSVSAGSGNFTGPIAATGSSNSFGVLNGVLWVDGVKYSTLSACYAALSAGGICEVPPGYTETLSSNLTLNKSNTGFVFLGEALITMNSFQIVIPGNTHGVFLKGTIPFGIQAGTLGVQFIYTGSGNAIQAGDGALATNRSFALENLDITIGNVSGATGLYMTNVVYWSLINIAVAGHSHAGEKAIVCDGTGNFCGTGSIINPILTFVDEGIVGKTGLGGADAMNAVTVLGGTIQTGTASGVGIDIQGGQQNQIYGTDLESNFIGVKFGADAVDNYVDVRSEANITDFSALSGSLRNIGKARGNASIVVSDAGTGNHFMLAKDSDVDAGRFASLTSKTASPATGGNSVNLAVSDLIAWRNAANSANHRLRKLGAAAGNVPVDTMFFDDGAGNPVVGLWQSPIIATSGTSPSVAGVIRMGNGDSPCWRNAGNTADLCLQAPAATAPAGVTVASGLATMTTAAIAAGACGTTVTVAASGALTTDRIDVSRSAAVSTPNGLLTLNWWPTSGNVNFNYCNPTASSQTPTAATVNWDIQR
jgi:hypothetical protein